MGPLAIDCASGVLGMMNIHQFKYLIGFLRESGCGHHADAKGFWASKSYQKVIAHMLDLLC